MQEGGLGFITVGRVLSMVRSGYFIVLIQSYQYCIRGGHNSFARGKQRCNPLSTAYEPTDWYKAIKRASEWGDTIPHGIIYRNDRISLEEHFPAIRLGPLAGRNGEKAILKKIIKGYK